MNNITFNGRFISSAQILKKGSNGQFLPHNVSLVQINPFNKHDILALESVNNSWKSAIFAHNISESARDVVEHNEDKRFLKFFVLTNQKKGFRKLDPKEILAELQVFFAPYEKQIEFMFLQANPLYKFSYSSNDRVYKHIGTGFMNAMKNFYAKKDIVLSATSSAMPFYAKNNFSKTFPVGNELIFKHK